MCKKIVPNILILSFAALMLSIFVRAQAEGYSFKPIDTFETSKGWEAITAEGTRLRLTTESGFTGKSLCLNYDLAKTQRYVIASKEISLALPSNYEFSFYVKTTGPANNLEFKIIDDKENTFWKRWDSFDSGGEWRKITVNKEDISYAWGPAPEADLERIKSIEFAVSAGAGGNGQLFIDELTLTALPEVKSPIPVSGLSEPEEKIESREFIVTGSPAWKTAGSLRKEASLNGIWKYSADPQKIGEANGYFKPDTDTSKWQDMKIPGNWAIENPDMFNYSGKVWFSRRFAVDEGMLASKSLRLQFTGVDYFAKVWLNGNYLGEHEGYFNPFDFEIKKYLNTQAPNILTVCIDSPKETSLMKKKFIKGIFTHHDCRPPDDKGNTGGIWSDVTVIGAGEIFIEDALVKPELNGDLSEAKISFECLLDNLSSAKKNANIKISFGGKNFSSDTVYLQKNVNLKPGKSRIILKTSIKNPRLWWTWDRGSPDLYKAGIFIESDDIISDDRTVTFGIRKIDFDEDKKILSLNGKRLFQRGTNYIATQWLSTFDKEKFDKDVQMMKDANLNAVRVHAHVLPQTFYEVCDEKGMLVWADFALIWVYRQDELFIRQACKQFKEFITGYYNHPSIWLWCAHNEGGENPKLNKALYEEGRKTDSLRVINEDSGSWDSHIYHGWYGEKLSDYLTDRKKFVTEYGAQAIPLSFAKFIPEEAQWPLDRAVWRYRNSQLNFQEKWIGNCSFYNSADEFSRASLKYQYDLIKFATEQYRRAKYDPVGGIYQFMFTECWPSITWAVVDNYRTPKPAYYALRDSMSPVLISIRWEKRFFEPGGTMQASLWAVNDYSYPINDCALYYEIKDAKGKTLFGDDRIKLDLEADSSKKVKDISFLIPADAKIGDVFQLSAQLKDATGKTLSDNRFVFRAQPKDESVQDLSGQWLFKKGDDFSYAGENADERDWAKMDVPASWESQGEKDYDGFAWYRKHVTIPESWRQKNISLSIGNIDDCDEAYFNGKKINSSGALPPKFRTACGQSRSYDIPKELIKLDEDNLIAIRVFDNSGEGGIVGGPVEIGELNRKYIPVYIEYPGME